MPLETSSRAYSIQFSTDAWRATGTISRDQFGRLNRLLGSLADAASLTNVRADGAPQFANPFVVVEVSGVRATYTFDHLERVLHVIELIPTSTLPAPAGAYR